MIESDLNSTYKGVFCYNLVSYIREAILAGTENEDGDIENFKDPLSHLLANSVPLCNVLNTNSSRSGLKKLSSLKEYAGAKSRSKTPNFL